MGRLRRTFSDERAMVFRLIITEHAANARLTARTRQQLAASIARTLILSTPTQLEARTAPRPPQRRVTGRGVSPDRLLGADECWCGEPAGRDCTYTDMVNELLRSMSWRPVLVRRTRNESSERTLDELRTPRGAKEG